MTTFILILALLFFIRKCRQLAAELNTAYAAIAEQVECAAKARAA